MDSEQFNAPPTTTATLAAYYRKYGADQADIRLVHFQNQDDIVSWLESKRSQPAN